MQETSQHHIEIEGDQTQQQNDRLQTPRRRQQQQQQQQEQEEKEKAQEEYRQQQQLVLQQQQYDLQCQFSSQQWSSGEFESPQVSIEIQPVTVEPAFQQTETGKGEIEIADEEKPREAQYLEQTPEQRQIDVRLSEESSPRVNKELAELLQNIPEEEELQQIPELRPKFRIPMGQGQVIPEFQPVEESSSLGPNIVQNLELQTAVEDAQKQVLTLQEQLKYKNFQLEQVQNALLTYEEEFAHQQGMKESLESVELSNTDVLQRIISRSLQLMEDQKNRELKEVQSQLSKQQEVIRKQQEERQRMGRDIREMQIAYENQLENMAKNTRYLVVQQDASKYQSGEQLKRVAAAERVRDSLEIKLYNTISELNLKTGDESLRSLYKQIQDLKQANTQLIEDLKQVLQSFGAAPEERLLKSQRSWPEELRTPRIPTARSALSSPFSVPYTVQFRPVLPLTSPNHLAFSATSYTSVTHQIIKMHQITDTFMQLNADLQAQLELCQGIDASAEQMLYGAMEQLKTAEGEMNTEESEYKFHTPRSEASNLEAKTPDKDSIHTCSTKLKEVQECITEIRDNLQKAIFTVYALSQQNSHLHLRIRGLEVTIRSPREEFQLQMPPVRPTPEEAQARAQQPLEEVQEASQERRRSRTERSDDGQHSLSSFLQQTVNQDRKRRKVLQIIFISAIVLIILLIIALGIAIALGRS